MKMINCNRCNNPMPELRKTKYGYDFCVDCSTVGAKRGIPIQMGSGDHTWTETVIMEEDEFVQVVVQDSINTKGKKNLSIKDFEDIKLEERNLQGPFTIINTEEE
jgi:hypothetical protein